MNRSTRTAVFGITLTLGLGACSEQMSGPGACNYDQDQAIYDHGDPEEIETRTVGGRRAETWWWWSRGISIEFLSDEDSTDCFVEEFRFPPRR